MLKYTPDNILLRLRYEIVSADTITYVKVSGGHFELEDTIKCYMITCAPEDLVVSTPLLTPAVLLSNDTHII